MRKRAGTYNCVCCGHPLFSSQTKYESGSGWPSFFAPISEDAIVIEEDLSYGMRRIEVMCAKNAVPILAMFSKMARHQRVSDIA